jgi:hypothetical protein
MLGLSYTSRFQWRARPICLAPRRSDLDYANPIEGSLGDACPGFGKFSL